MSTRNEFNMDQMRAKAPPVYSPTQNQYPAAAPMNMQHYQTENTSAAPNIVVVTQAGAAPVGPEPQRMTCPYCSVKMLTRLDYRSTYRTHLFALAFCFSGLFCFVPLPYLMKSCRSLDHYCTSCDAFIGKTSA